MSRKTLNKGPVHLRFDDGEVLVTAKDSDRFVLAAKQAVDALQRESALEQWVARFADEYLPRVYNWCLRHQDKVTACYLGKPSGPALPLFIVGASETYDFGLGEELSAFALELSDAGWYSEVLQIPKSTDDDLRAFFNPDEALQVYA